MSTDLEERLTALAASDDMTTTRRTILTAAAAIIAELEHERDVIADLDADLTPPLEHTSVTSRHAAADLRRLAAILQLAAAELEVTYPDGRDHLAAAELATLEHDIGHLLEALNTPLPEADA